jgi:hypothetical protein
MKERKLPNFRKLKEEGTFAPLPPSVSPVTRSCFMAMIDPPVIG